MPLFSGARGAGRRENSLPAGICSINEYMKPHSFRPAEALRALGVFLWECAKDRPYGSLPLRDMTDAEDVVEFHEGLERLLRAILLDYSLERRHTHLYRSISAPRVVRDWQ